MSANPVHYRGLTRLDTDEGSVHNGPRSSSFDISGGNESADSTNSGRPTISVVTILYFFSTITFIILAIIGVVYLGDINSIAQDYANAKDTPSGYSASQLTTLGARGGNNNGRLVLYSDASGSLVMQVPYDVVHTGTEILMVEQLITGTGNRDLYWDAGAVISEDVVLFRQAGTSQLQLVARQQAYRSGTAGLMERSFPDAVLWTFDILHSTGAAVLISLDDFLLSGIGNTNGNDISTVISALYGAQHSYIVDRPRSAVNLTASTANDYRVLLERTATYTLTNTAIPPLASVGKQFSVTSRRTLLLLDKYAQTESRRSGQKTYSAYQPRPYHPSSGFNYMSFMNEDAGLLDLRQQLNVVRFRLYPTVSSSAATVDTLDTTDTAAAGASQHADVVAHKGTPAGSPTSVPAQSQLVYYVDSAAPPGIKEALVEGVNWWDQAFQAAGYPAGTFYAATVDRSAFDGHDLHSPKRNFVEWIDRDLRAYSLGQRIIDPRTGEILKGHVRIENLRMRQDALIAEALLGPFGATGSQAAAAAAEQGTAVLSAEAEAGKQGSRTLEEALQRQMDQLAQRHSRGELDSTAKSHAADSQLVDDVAAAILQRVRQLGAHEVGHTLGLAHNYAGSSHIAGYASVMDYPAPIVTLDPTGTKLVLNAASYANGIGAFDKVSIRYAYQQLGSVSATQERVALNKILQDAMKNDGYLFLTDEDSAISGGDWRDSQWDHGDNPVAALNTTLAVRALAMRKLESSDVLPVGAPFSRLQELFPIVYLWHRYAVASCAKLIGGYTFQYGTKEAGKQPTSQALQTPVPATVQLAALDQLLTALDPAQLHIPASLAQRLVPNAFGYVPDVGGVLDLMATRTGPGTFDYVASVESGAMLVVSSLLSPARLERLAAQLTVDPTLPSLHTVLSACTQKMFGTAAMRGFPDTLVALMTIQNVYTNVLLVIANDVATYSTLVREMVGHELLNVKVSFDDLPAVHTGGNGELSHMWDIHRYKLKNAIDAGKPFLTPLKIPAGPPI